MNIYVQSARGLHIRLGFLVVVIVLLLL